MKFYLSKDSSIAPFLITLGGLTVTSTIVEGIPGSFPPSIIRSTGVSLKYSTTVSIQSAGGNLIDLPMLL